MKNRIEYKAIKVIKSRKKQFLGHAMLGKEMENLMLIGKFKEKRAEAAKETDTPLSECSKLSRGK